MADLSFIPEYKIQISDDTTLFMRTGGIFVLEKGSEVWHLEATGGSLSSGDYYYGVPWEIRMLHLKAGWSGENSFSCQEKVAIPGFEAWVPRTQFKVQSLFDTTPPTFTGREIRVPHFVPTQHFTNTTEGQSYVFFVNIMSHEYEEVPSDFKIFRIQPDGTASEITVNAYESRTEERSGFGGMGHASVEVSEFQTSAGPFRLSRDQSTLNGQALTPDTNKLSQLRDPQSWQAVLGFQNEMTDNFHVLTDAACGTQAITDMNPDVALIQRLAEGNFHSNIQNYLNGLSQKNPILAWCLKQLEKQNYEFCLYDPENKNIPQHISSNMNSGQVGALTDHSGHKVYLNLSALYQDAQALQVPWTDTLESMFVHEAVHVKKKTKFTPSTNAQQDLQDIEDHPEYLHKTEFALMDVAVEEALAYAVSDFYLMQKNKTKVSLAEYFKSDAWNLKKHVALAAAARAVYGLRFNVAEERYYIDNLWHRHEQDLCRMMKQNVAHWFRMRALDVK